MRHAPGGRGSPGGLSSRNLLLNRVYRDLQSSSQEILYTCCQKPGFDRRGHRAPRLENKATHSGWRKSDHALAAAEGFLAALGTRGTLEHRMRSYANLSPEILTAGSNNAEIAWARVEAPQSHTCREDGANGGANGDAAAADPGSSRLPDHCCHAPAVVALPAAPALAPSEPRGRAHERLHMPVCASAPT